MWEAATARCSSNKAQTYMKKKRLLLPVPLLLRPPCACWQLQACLALYEMRRGKVGRQLAFAAHARSHRCKEDLESQQEANRCKP